MSDKGPHTHKTITICSDHLEYGRITLPKGGLYARGVQVQSIHCANSWHNVNATQNKIHLTQRFTSGETTLTVDGTVMVPDGNYNATQFITVLQTALNNSGVGGWQGAWTVTLNETTHRLRIQNDTREFIVRDGPDSLNSVMGYIANNLYGQSKTASNVVNMAPIRMLRLVSRELGNALVDVMWSGSPDNNSTIAVMPVTGAFGQFITHRPHTGSYMQLGNGQALRIVSFDLDIVDEQGKSVDFLGAPWYVEMSFI